jgi:hypothetical protein
MTKLKAGEWVEVRSKEEILTTLDANGELDGMPFMPEMFAFCGKRFRVYKRAHKTCDTVFPVRGRRIDRTVHLETRCDGQAHGGCQASCLIFWKEAWLRRIDAQDNSGWVDSKELGRESEAACREPEVWRNAQTPDPNDGEPVYSCQATRLPYATKELAWWDLRQYFEDYLSGNVGLLQILRGALYSAYYNLSQAGIGLGPLMRWLYTKISVLLTNKEFPRNTGNIPQGQPTPTASLNLQPGELVRVKSHQEILKTLNTASKNRGLYWDAEMVPYCGGTYRVLKRVTRIIDEKTGRMQEMKSPCIILDSVVCKSQYSHCRMFCPRSIFSYWREIWLERVGHSPEAASAGEESQRQCVSSS